jgi:TolB-like protein
MFRKTIVFLVVLCCLSLLSACSRFNCTRLESLLGGDVNLVSLGRDIADTLIREAMPPLVPRQPDQPVFITTPVENDHLEQTSSFARGLQNGITAEFVRQGFTVNEIRLRGNVEISDQGEFMLSRDLMELKEKRRAQAVVVATYTLADRVMYLSVRLVRPGTSMIMAVYEKRICLDARSLKLLGLNLSSEEPVVTPPSESILDKIFYW